MCEKHTPLIKSEGIGGKDGCGCGFVGLRSPGKVKGFPPVPLCSPGSRHGEWKVEIQSLERMES